MCAYHGGMDNPKVSRTYRIDPSVSDRVADAAFSAGMPIERWVEAVLAAAAGMTAMLPPLPKHTLLRVRRRAKELRK